MSTLRTIRINSETVELHEPKSFGAASARITYRELSDVWHVSVVSATVPREVWLDLGTVATRSGAIQAARNFFANSPLSSN